MAIPIEVQHNQSFFSTNETVAIAVGTASANAALVTPGEQYQAQIVNDGTNVVYVNFGTDNTVAAAVPASGTPAQGFPILPNSRIVISIGSTTWIAAIAAATGNTLLITVGKGTS
ncbi:MAG: hypothetical protein GJU73_05320 [Ferrovum sp.]|jgi:hypothetical protein|uniref:hypothetical protein n=1 Tax=Ferrovum sp. TaxID=2609467 RepID=UPI0026033785|nr:hypothetical protein [Ferrovum sp.]MBW8066849.1 hypothetical protein [Ferrovum sp.]